MRKLLSSLIILFGCNLLSAQNYCYTTEMQNAWFTKHPELKAAFEKHQQVSEEIDNELFKTGYKLAGKSAAAGNYTIPVVFHILHLGGSENISDAQVNDAMSILTRDFNADNADTSDVVIQFKHLIGNPQIDFMLATKDPNGNCTNGIIRHYDANTDWSGSGSNYAYTWPATRYLNVYVVRTMGGGAAGYTYLPGSGIPAAMDAIVILNGYVGSIGSGNLATSRALTHEVGHWLNLPHVWGGTNQPGVACGNDGVNDTPITKGYTSCNLNNSTICTPGIVENVQNYMDYAYCQRMYTIGQASRMQTAINSPIAGRNNLSTPNNLAFTGITSPGVGCIPDLDILANPALVVCSGKTLSLASYTFNASPTNYLWTADNSASVVNPTAATTPVLFTNQGITQVSCLVSNANGSSSKTIAINVQNGVTQIISTNSESFYGPGVTLPTSWKVVSPTSPLKKWEIVNNIGSDGIGSAYVPGELLDPNDIVILESPSYDFKNNPGVQFSFKYAYAWQSTSHKDVFKVQASKNCGGIWLDVWVPTNSFLALNTGGVLSDLYYPLSVDWQLRNITQQPQFYSFLSEENVLIRFYFQENKDGIGSGNRFYLDEVNFTGVVGINDLTKAVAFNVFPNPTSDVINLSFQLSDFSKIKYELVTVTGEVISNESEKTYSEGSYTISINKNTELAAGIYFINLHVNGAKMCKKIIVK
ncbi:zinc-dependent metalloprotease [Aurantibacillus circumpalustris]|uniref:zinc-dependent metalloprotease n=1 Tax=Aurantibacillus circumpalustris TaxID=3036359 RepID=UPI00295B25A3|nr:zinc-dependent metalloprotease [Aurantibacillus circumpalustris]